MEGSRSLGNAKRCAVEVKAWCSGRMVPGSHGAEMKCTRRKGRNVETATKKSGSWGLGPRTEEEQWIKCIQWLRGAGRGLIRAAVQPVAHAASGVPVARLVGGGAVRLGARDTSGRSTLRREGRSWWRPAGSLPRGRLTGTTCVTRSGCKAFTLGGLRHGSPHVALRGAGRVAASCIGGPLWTVPACCGRTATQVRHGVRARNARTCVLPW